MNNIHRRRAACLPASWPHALGLAGVLVLVLSVPAAGNATPPSLDTWHANADSVLELLQADTRRALEDLRVQEKPVAAGALPASPPARAADRIELAALYGVSGSLTAVVYVNGVRKEYRPGAKLPYGGNGSANEYRLLRIVQSCVVLQKASAKSVRSACFQPAPEPVSPSLAGNTAVAGHPAALSMPLPAPGRP